MSKKTKKIYIFIKERVKKMDRDRFLDFLCKDAIKIHLDKNQYFSSINNHENTAYCLISGVCALLRFTQNGEEIIYHYFKEKDVIGGVPLFLSHKGASGIHSLYSFCSLYTKTRCELYKIPFFLYAPNRRNCNPKGIKSRSGEEKVPIRSQCYCIIFSSNFNASSSFGLSASVCNASRTQVRIWACRIC